MLRALFAVNVSICKKYKLFGSVNVFITDVLKNFDAEKFKLKPYEDQ